MRRRSLPVDFEGFVQRSQMRLEVRLNAAIRIGPAHDGENGKQQYVRQPIEFALGATRVRDCGEQRQKRLQGLQGLQGDLPSIRSPHTDSDFFAPRNRPLRLSHQELENCCIWDSVESVEQPWLGPEPVRKPQKILLIDGFQYIGHRPLDNLVFECGNRQWTLRSIRLRYKLSAGGQRPISASMNTRVQVSEF